jgi:hypothetical protein
MNFKLVAEGFVLLLIGLLMYFNVRKRRPASEETNWKGQLLPQYVGFWCATILCIIAGVVLIIKSL